MRLKPDLQNTNDWPEHDQIPKPAGEEIGTVAAERNSQDGNANEKRSGTKDRQQRRLFERQRIKNGESFRPDELVNVGTITERGISQSIDQRNGIQGAFATVSGK